MAAKGMSVMKNKEGKFLILRLSPESYELHLRQVF
jgi:hypothetical protein